MEVSFWYLGSSQRKCRTHAVLSVDVEKRELGSWAGRIAEQHPCERTGGTVPSHFIGFLLEAPAPSVTCLLTHTLCHLHIHAWRCMSQPRPFLWGGTTSYPHTGSFSTLSLQGVCLTDLPCPPDQPGHAGFLLILFFSFSPSFSSSKVPLGLAFSITPLFFLLPQQESVDAGAEQSASAPCL